MNFKNVILVLSTLEKLCSICASVQQSCAGGWVTSSFSLLCLEPLQFIGVLPTGGYSVRPASSGLFCDLARLLGLDPGPFPLSALHRALLPALAPHQHLTHFTCFLVGPRCWVTLTHWCIPWITIILCSQCKPGSLQSQDCWASSLFRWPPQKLHG